MNITRAIKANVVGEDSTHKTPKPSTFRFRDLPLDIQLYIFGSMFDGRGEDESGQNSKAIRRGATSLMTANHAAHWDFAPAFWAKSFVACRRRPDYMFFFLSNATEVCLRSIQRIRIELHPELEDVQIQADDLDSRFHNAFALTRSLLVDSGLPNLHSLSIIIGTVDRSVTEEIDSTTNTYMEAVRHVEEASRGYFTHVRSRLSAIANTNMELRVFVSNDGRHTDDIDLGGWDPSRASFKGVEFILIKIG